MNASGWAVVFRWLAGFGLLLGILLALAYLSLRWYVWPQVDELGPRLLATVNQQFPRPIQVKAMRGDIVAGRPVLRIEGMSMDDQRGQAALGIGVFEAELSITSLFWGEIQFNRAKLQDVSITARRINAQSLEIAGWPLALDQPSDQRLLQWLLTQPRIEVANMSLRWKDELRDSEVLLEGLQLEAVNQLREHRWRIDARRVGGALQDASLVAQFHHGLLKKPQEWKTWQGNLFFGAQNLDLAESIRWIDADWLPSLLPQAGKLQVATWTDFSAGQVRKLQARLAGQDFALKTPKAGLQLARLQTAFTAMPKYAPSGSQLQSVDLKLSEWSVDDGLGGQLRGTPAAQRLVLSSDGRLLEGSLALEPFDVSSAMDLARRLPLPTDMLAAIQSLRARGQVSRLAVHFEDRLALGRGAGSSYGADLTVNGLALDWMPQPSSAQPWPSFAGLSGEVQLDETGGTLSLSGEDASLRFPGLFEEADFAVQSASGKVRWKYGKRPQDIRIDVDALEFANADGQAQVKGHYQSGGKGAGIFDMKGQLTDVRAERIVRYLPLVVSQELRTWLKSAVHGGRVSKANFVLRGDIEDFPFSAPGSGQFLVEGQLAGSRLDYAKAWPAIDEVIGNLRFEAAAMQIDVRSGKVMGLSLANTRASIAALDVPVLRISGTANGAANDMIRFVNASPIAAKINQFSQDMHAQGDASLDLSLILPLDDLDRSEVLGTVQLPNNDLRFAPDLPGMSKVRGAFAFTEKALFVRETQAQFLGGTVTLSGNTDNDGLLRVKASGRASAEGLRSFVEHPAMRALEGYVDYQADIALEGQGMNMRVESDGLGLVSRLPPPMAKSAKQRWPIRIDMVPGQRFGGHRADSTVLRDDQIRIRLRDDTQIWLGRERSQPTEPMRLRAGVIAIDSEPLLPSRGLAISAKLEHLSLDPWIALLQGNGQNSAGPLVPERLALSAEHLRYGERELHGAVIGASYDRGHWRLNLESQEAAGFASWRVDSPDDPGEVFARFRRVNWPQTEPDLAKRMRQLDLAPQRLPAMDIQIESLRIGDRDLGASALKASSRRNDGVWIWGLDELQMQIQGARLLASGQWKANNMEVELDLKIENAGQAMSKLGFPDSFQGGEGRLASRLSWQGLPWDPQYASLGGRMELALGRGRFLRTEPGVAKLLSVFNLQSLPRRLSLDFSDIFSSGYSFDGLRGTATIREGVVHTDDFSMVGLQAVVGLRGRIDLSQETQIMEAQVVPNLDAGMAAVAYGALINPFVGLGSLVAQYALAEPLKRILTYRYAISGSWDEPQVVELGRENFFDVLRQTAPRRDSKPKEKPG